MTRLMRSDYPPADKGLVVVWGLLAHSPFGGMTWQVLHHLVGLRRLGFDVWYVEDSDRYPYALGGGDRTVDVGPNVEFMHRHLAAVGLGDRWVFRSPTEPDETAGALDVDGLQRLYRDADAVLNLCGAQELLPRHDVIDCLVYLETDPVVSQVGVAQRERNWIQWLDRYQHHFTYATNLGGPGWSVPLPRYDWVPTVPPVVTDWWTTDTRPDQGAALTTILQWSSVGHDVQWRDECWRWRKDVELVRYLDLPASVPVPVEAAIRVGERERAAAQVVAAHGWRTRPAERLDDPFAYRRYIRGSLGEFSVAKHQYVASRSGWFSDRTVCYLAAGRPVVVQDTGFRSAAGRPQRGLHVFCSLDEASASIHAVAGDYERESETARAIAHDVFEAERVLGSLMATVGLV
ncbi:hypothetical protein [Geodermatophilus sp. SYSU D00684]